MSRTLTVAEMVARDVGRRRGVVGLLFLLPLVFYLARRDSSGQAIRFASLGVAWAVSTAALFSAVSGHGVDPRLRLAGYRPAELVAGRVLALTGLGLTVSACYLVLVAVDQPVRHLPAIALELALTVAVAVPLGLVLGLLVPRDLEGTLLLIGVVGAQMILDPADDSARVLPFWSTREIITYAVDPPGSASLSAGVTHGVAVAVGLGVLSGALATVRLRRRRHLRFVPG